MFMHFQPISGLVIIAAALFISCTRQDNSAETFVSSSNDDLVSLFHEFREFERPAVTNGLPDYSPAAMQGQHKGLRTFQNRLAAIDISNLPVSHKVDYYIVRAEMNGLDFYHRVLKPWSRDPVFYLQSQRGAGPGYYGGVRINEVPLSPAELNDVSTRLRAVPALYDQAKSNLTEASGDLAKIALHFLGEEIRLYNRLAERFKDFHPELLEIVNEAVTAVEDYGDWLEENLQTMTAPAGIGKENYNWWMKNVQLLPYTWDELLIIAEHEYDRSMALLKIERHRNRDLPELELVKSEAEYHRLDNLYQQFLMRFIEENDLFSIPGYVEPVTDTPWSLNRDRQYGTARDFFEQSKDRLPLHMRSHNFIGHAIDGMRDARDDRPIRGENRLYAMDMVRHEGMAYALEGFLMHSGAYKNYPRGRELNYIAMAFRAVRSITDLKMHSNEFTLEEGSTFFVDNTPFGWTLPDGQEVWYESETTLRHPGWHTGMHIGKHQYFTLLADRSDQLGDDFVMRDFMDTFFEAGSIPFSLIRWEITGLDDEIRTLIQ